MGRCGVIQYFFLVWGNCDRDVDVRRNTVIVEACNDWGVLVENERDKNGHGDENEEDYDDRE